MTRHPFSRVLLLAAGVATIALSPATAEARHRLRVRLGGHVHVHVGPPMRPVYVVAPAPPPVVYAYPFAEPPPPEPPCCAEPPPCCAEPVYAPPPPPVPTVVAQPAPRSYRIGLGVSLASVDGSGLADGVGAGLRLRGRRLEVELNVGHDVYEGGRRDTRVGGDLYLNLTSGRFVPYLLVGGGWNMVEQDAVDVIAQQAYAEVGAGLALRISPRFTIAGDLRAAERSFIPEEPCCATADVAGLSDKETLSEARLAGIFYF